MASSERLRVAVVGAGAGGLFAAAYLAKAGLSVEVFEAQAHVGGCASCFSIGPHRFHAGATTLVGLEEHMPLARILRELSLEVPHHTLERALAIVHGGRALRLEQDTARNAAALEARYGRGLAGFWQHSARVAPRAWSLIGDAPLPPKTFGDLATLATSRDAWRLLPELTTTTRARAERFGLLGESAAHLLDELLLVSTQSTSERTPALFGAVGCEYLERPLYMPHGGLGALFERLAESLEGRGARVHRRARVERIRAGERSFHVGVNGVEEPFDALVLGVTCWDAAKLFDPAGDLGRALARTSRRHERSWSAAGGYFAYDDVFAPETPVYTQIVLDAPMASTGARGLFVTLPPKTDAALVSTPGVRTMTVSCHTEPGGWFEEDDTRFKERRARLMEEIQGALRLAFPGIVRATCHAAHPATPRTWESFTGRHRGRVGGLPFELSLRTLAYPSGRTPSPRVFAVGDTVFPGQSVTATALGARRGALSLLGSLAAGA